MRPVPTAIAMAILLHGCSGGDGGPGHGDGPRPHAPRETDVERRRQAAADRYVGKGRWSIIAIAGAGTFPMAAYSSGPDGGRLVVLRPGTGYEVRLVDIGCASGGARQSGGIRFDSDGGGPSGVTRGPAPFPGEALVAAVCRNPPKATTDGAPPAAVARARTAYLAANPPPRRPSR